MQGCKSLAPVFGPARYLKHEHWLVLTCFFMNMLDSIYSVLCSLGTEALLNYIGGTFIFVHREFADRIRRGRAPERGLKQITQMA